MEQFHPKLFAVANKCIDLQTRVGFDALTSIGGNVVVNDRNRGIRTAHLAARYAQTLVGLRRCDLRASGDGSIYKGHVPSFSTPNHMRFPDFLEQRARLAHIQLASA